MDPTRRARLFWGVAFWVALATTGSALAQRTNDLRAEALRLYKAGLYRESLPYFDEVLKRKSHDLECLNKRGCAHLRLNQPELAIPDFDRYIGINPSFDIPNLFGGSSDSIVPAYAEAVTNRGIAKVMLGRDDEAMDDFQRSIFLHRVELIPNPPGLASCYCGIGQVFHRKGNNTRALDAFARAVAINPNDPNGYVGQGLALAGIGMVDQALTSYGEAIRLDPNHSRAYGYRGVALEKVGRPDDALKDYDQTVRLDPHNAMTRRYRAALLSRLGRNDDALRDLDVALRLDPSDAGTYKDRGGVYNRTGDYAKALVDLDEALRLDPKSAKAYSNRAASYNALGRYPLAVRDCDRALELEPNLANAFNNRAVARIALDQHERAIDDLNDALRINPGLVVAYVTRAEAYVRLGQADHAALDYEDALRRDPRLAENSEVMARVNDTLKRVGRTPKADTLALRDAQTRASADFDRANGLRSHGDWPGAIAAYTQAIDGDPSLSDAYGLRGWSRLCAGEAGAEADARQGLDRKGWRDPFAPYLALLGHFAARRDGHDREAAVFLDEAIANTRPPAWPSPLFRYLRHLTSAEALIASADDPNKLTEARSVIGEDLHLNGQNTAAAEHLRWVVENGVAGSIGRDLARETLRRINRPPSPPAVPPH